MEGEGGEKYIAKRLWPEQEARPPTTDTLTIIFFHGLQMLDGTDTSETTWKNRLGTVCWPQVWLPEDLGKERVRVLSMSYDSIASCWGLRGQTEDLRAIGSDLVEKFITMYSRLPLHTPFFPLSDSLCLSLSLGYIYCLSFSPMQIKTRG
jgi:hypothetical protein